MEKQVQGETEGFRTKVLVVTEQYEFSGYLHRMSADRRETDILNDERIFIHLTEVVARIRGEVPTKRVPFVAVNKANILFVIPLEEEYESPESKAQMKDFIF
jgi:hypothetical protein